MGPTSALEFMNSRQIRIARENEAAGAADAAA
jgi:hypothetical protein